MGIEKWRAAIFLPVTLKKSRGYIPATAGTQIRLGVSDGANERPDPLGPPSEETAPKAALDPKPRPCRSYTIASAARHRRIRIPPSPSPHCAHDRATCGSRDRCCARPRSGPAPGSGSRPSRSRAGRTYDRVPASNPCRGTP